MLFWKPLIRTWSSPASAASTTPAAAEIAIGISPEAMTFATWELLWRVTNSTSKPYFSKIPASLASQSGASDALKAFRPTFRDVRGAPAGQGVGSAETAEAGAVVAPPAVALAGSLAAGWRLAPPVLDGLAQAARAN